MLFLLLKNMNNLMLELLWIIMKHHYYVKKMWDHCFYLKALSYLITLGKRAVHSSYLTGRK